MKHSQYNKLLAGIVAAWFAFVVSAAALGVFNNAAQRLGVAVALAASVPLVVFLAWYGASREFREYTMSLSPRALTYFHSWRVMGIVFVTLMFLGRLPALFALPAGLGDIAMGLTAPWAARNLVKPEKRGSFITWQALGILDLVVAVSIGTTARLLSPTSVPMTPMTVLPLSLVPTFLVPLLMMAHFVAIAQARRWGVERRGVIGQSVAV